MNIEDIKKLRDMTGAGMMAAKKALEETGGDLERAVDVLRLAGAATAAKKADREARNGIVESYVHSGRIGVLVEINCETDFVARTEDFKNFAHDVAMHIAAASPEFTTPEEVPADRIEKEKAFFAAELDGQNKPAEMMAKIVEGKLGKFYESVCLTRQPFVKDPDQSIDDLTRSLIGKTGENIVVRRFMRLELGVNG